MEIAEIYTRTNIHPNWRKLGLSSIRQVRMMLREGRYTTDCKRIIKQEQRWLLANRRKLAEAAR